MNTNVKRDNAKRSKTNVLGTHLTTANSRVRSQLIRTNAQQYHHTHTKKKSVARFRLFFFPVFFYFRCFVCLFVCFFFLFYFFYIWLFSFNTTLTMNKCNGLQPRRMLAK